MHKNQGTSHSTGLFPDSCFYGGDYRLQQILFLLCGAVQMLEGIICHVRVDIRHPILKLFHSFLRLWVVYFDFDGRIYSADGGHLLL